MEIASIRHRGLRRFVENNDASGLPAPYVDKIRKMLSFLQDAQDVSELKSIPAWKAHILTGARRGTWALHVSPNWRLTFRVDSDVVEIIDLNFEDYH